MRIADSIATFTTTADFLNSVANQAIVKPESFNGYGGFVFDITDNDSITLKSDITDHYSEDNIAKNDNIALNPEEITVNGFVGELKERPPAAVPFSEVVEEKLTEISEYAPVFPTPLTQAYVTARNTLDVVNAASKGVENIYDVFMSNEPQDKTTAQAQAFSYFYALWQAREIFTIDTPYKTFTNMSISVCEVLQSDSIGVSEFNITFKKLRFTKTVLATSGQGRRVNQLAKVQEKGTLRGEPVGVTKSLASRLLDEVTGE